MTLEEEQHLHFSHINERNYSAVFNDINLPKGGTHIAGYAIISAVGLNALDWVKDISVLNQSTIFRLKSLGIRVCGKTGVTTCNKTSSRALQVVGAITRGKKRVSSFVDEVYEHMCINKNHQAVHLIFGIGLQEGKLEGDEVKIEADIRENILLPLGVEVLNMPGRFVKAPKYNRNIIEIDLDLILPNSNSN